MADASWYRLDNVGKFYAAQAGSPNQTIFRLAATMVDEVDEQALQRALDAAVAQFPGFNVSLRSGMFWHYLEPSGTAPRVTPENLPICYGLHAGPQSVLFRVSYYRRRINVEVSHMISDGRGALEFLKALLGAYVAERYGLPEAATCAYAGTEAQKTEDSFTANYDRAAAGKAKKPRVFHLTGLKTDADPLYLEYHLSASAVHAAAKDAGVSVTSYLIAAVICAVRTTMTARDRRRAIHLDVPVDLRSLFGSATLRNFFGLAFITYTPGDADAPLVEVAAEVQRQLTAGCEPASLKRRMMAMIKLEKNPLLRAAPLIVKDAALAIADARAALRCRTIQTVPVGGSVLVVAEVLGQRRGIERVEYRSRGAGSVHGPLRGRHQRAHVHLRPQLHRVHLRRRSIHRHLQPLPRPEGDPRPGRGFGRRGDARISEREPRRAGVPPPRSAGGRPQGGSRAIGVPAELLRAQEHPRPHGSGGAHPYLHRTYRAFGRHCGRQRAGRGGAVCGRGPELAVRAEHDRARPRLHPRG